MWMKQTSCSSGTWNILPLPMNHIRTYTFKAEKHFEVTHCFLCPFKILLMLCQSQSLSYVFRKHEGLKSTENKSFCTDHYCFHWDKNEVWLFFFGKELVSNSSATRTLKAEKNIVSSLPTPDFSFGESSIELRSARWTILKCEVFSLPRNINY